jgi:hypothetical protein
MTVTTTVCAPAHKDPAYAMADGSPIAALADRIARRHALFAPGGCPETDLDTLADADEADLHMLAGMADTTSPEAIHAKAAVLVGRDLAGGMSLGEAAVLRSLLADLTA